MTEMAMAPELYNLYLWHRYSAVPHILHKWASKAWRTWWHRYKQFHICSPFFFRNDQPGIRKLAHRWVWHRYRRWWQVRFWNFKSVPCDRFGMIFGRGRVEVNQCWRRQRTTWSSAPGNRCSYEQWCLSSTWFYFCRLAFFMLYNRYQQFRYFR